MINPVISTIQELLVHIDIQRKEAAELSDELTKLSESLYEWSGGQQSAQEVVANIRGNFKHL